MNKQHFPQKLLERKYQEFGSIKKTAKYFGTGYGAVRRALIEYGIPLLPPKTPLEYDDVLTKDVLLAKCKEIKSIKGMSIHFGVSHHTIKHYMKIHGVVIDKDAWKENIYRGTVDDNLFSTDTETSMYLAGFIAADGCLYEKEHGTGQLCIGLGKRDLAHLKKIKSLLKSENKLTRTQNDKGSVIYSLQITSKQIWEDLTIRFNMTPRKSLTYKFPERLIGHPLVHHFIRGFIDGDGSFYHRKNGNVGMSIIGTEDVMTKIRDIINATCTIRSNHKVSKGSGRNIKTFSISYRNQPELVRIAKWLYRDASLLLPRKQKIAMSVKLPAIHSETGRARKISDDDVKELRRLAGTMTHDALAKQFGISRGHVSTIIRGETR